jgi:hypothetical protein
LWIHARRSEEKGRNRRNPRHSGLDPESRIVFSGAKRRILKFDERTGFRVKPEMTKFWGFRRASALASPGV